MKKDEFICTMNSIIPAAEMKSRIIIKLSGRHNRYHLDKPLHLVASFGVVAIVCACAMICAFILKGRSDPGKVLVAPDETSHYATISSATSTATRFEASPSSMQVKLLDNIQLNAK
jgi:hypothetical protein